MKARLGALCREVFQALSFEALAFQALFPWLPSGALLVQALPVWARLGFRAPGRQGRVRRAELPGAPSAREQPPQAAFGLARRRVPAPARGPPP